METKFTPGPWHADPLGVVTGGRARLTSICTMPIQQWVNSIFYVTTADDFKQETSDWLNECLAEAKANAALIADAPTMHSQLELCAAAFADHLGAIEAGGSGITGDYARGMLNDIHALLAKIKGAQ